MSNDNEPRYSFAEVEAWIKKTRDEYHGTRFHHTNTAPHYRALDDLLDDLRLHWVTGTPLTEHACEGPYCNCADE